jgi:DNA-binding NarL/FixJ family response regulator
VAELAAVIAEAEERRTPGVILREGAIILPVLRQAATLGVATASVTRLLSLLGADAGPERPAEVTGAEPLTQRERDVLRLIVVGASNREIAAELVITEETVKTHVARILRKLNVTSRARAAVRARETGWFA